MRQVLKFMSHQFQINIRSSPSFNTHTHTHQILTIIFDEATRGSLSHERTCYNNSVRHDGYKDFKGIPMITRLSNSDKIQMDISNDVACHTRKPDKKNRFNFWKREATMGGGFVAWACFHTWRNLNRRQSSAPAPLSRAHLCDCPHWNVTGKNAPVGDLLMRPRLPS